MGTLQTITALSIDAISFDNENYILSEVKGLESPVVRLPRYNLPGSSGAFVSNTLYGERQISIKGYVNAPNGSRATYLNNRTALLNAIAFKRDVNNNIVPQLMTISLENGVHLTMRVYVDQPIQMGFTQDTVEIEEFLLSLVAPDPNLYSTDLITQTIQLAMGGGTPIPTPIPMNLAAASGGNSIVNNPGSVYAYPIITLNPPLLNPFITNLETNLFMSLNVALDTGDIPITIDMQAQTIKQGNVDISSLKVVGSQFWYLLNGNNHIGFSAATGTGTAIITFFPAFVGV